MGRENSKIGWLGRALALSAGLFLGGKAGADTLKNTGAQIEQKSTAPSHLSRRDMPAIMPGELNRLTLEQKKLMAKKVLGVLAKVFANIDADKTQNLSADENALTYKPVFESGRLSSNALRNALLRLSPLLNAEQQNSLKLQHGKLAVAPINMLTPEFDELEMWIKARNATPAGRNEIYTLYRALESALRQTAKPGSAEGPIKIELDVEDALLQPSGLEKRPNQVEPTAIEKKPINLNAAETRKPKPSERIFNSAVRKHTADGKPIFYFSFDDGPYPKQTAQILDECQKNGVKATFFLVGDNIRAYGKNGLIQRMRNEGHAIGLHSNKHADMREQGKTMIPEQVFEEYVLAPTAALARLGIVPDKIYRPPYGEITKEQFDYFTAQGYYVVKWDNDPAEHQFPSAGKIINTVTAQAHPGSFALLHDGGGHRPNTLAAFPQIIRNLQAQGYGFDTVPVGLNISEPSEEPASTPAPINIKLDD